MLKFDPNNLPKLDFKKAKKKPIAIKCVQIDEAFEVKTMEGKLTGKAGDWLMVGIDGEIYPCDAAIFKKTYDLIE
ncbi:hypothetical protein [Gelidibacter algens]|nr:hypothetical protein [Gelidibacter algens]OBX20142.1 hypothetical protein A9996_18775 [Gelidibacter algens]